MKHYKRAMGIAMIVTAMLALLFTLSVSARQANEAASGAAVSADARVPGQFLTGPNAGAPLDIALAYINSNADALGFTAADVANVVVSDQYMSAHNGVTHIYLQQRLNGIRVHNAILNINIASDGSVINLGNRFVPNLVNAVVANEPAMTAAQAVDAVARQLGYSGAAPQLVELVGGVTGRVIFDGAGISFDDIAVELMYQPTDAGVRLAWDMTINELNNDDWWSIRADAATGRILSQINYVVHENQEVGGRLASAELEVAGTVVTSGAAAAQNFVPESYRVFAYPLESPDDGPDTLELNPFDITSNPFGWHDTNGAAGPEFTITQGNNVHADSDTDANNTPDGNSPDGGAGLVFDFPFNLTLQPSEYLTSSIVNLFYWNNIMHDISYRYGFDEAAGNFQENNYGNGGAGSDYVFADAQDGSGTCNANFGTPPDGSNPRMQQFNCTNPFSQMVTVNSPAGIAGDYVANPSNNGGTANGLTADMELVVDGTAPFDDACETVTNDLTGKIALIRWSGGLCNSSVFVQNAANAGAIAAIIIDNTVDPLTNFGGSAAIPSVAVGSTDGQLFVDTLVTDPINATIDDNTTGGVDRDTDLDNGVVAHEYGHGISNRLTGGPSQVGCLSNAEQMGEGWSDLMTLYIHADPADQGTDARGIGTYSFFNPTGIRNFPYSTDMMVNPQVYNDIATTNLPHGLGSIWVAATWEVYWNLVDKHGFNPNIYDAWSTGGNNLAFQLVMDGMKMQPCSPGFVDGRDAILAADQVLTAGDNQCEIWQGFAKRGVGLSADQGSSNDVSDGLMAFDMPLECMPDETVATGPDNITMCAGQSYDWTVALGDFPEPPVALSAVIAPDPLGTGFSWSTNPVDLPPMTTTLTLSSTAGVTVDGFYTTTITASSGTAPVTFDMHVTFESVAPTAPGIVSPPNGSGDAGYMPKLTWTAVAGATGYDVDVATDAGFTNIIDSGSALASETSYPVAVVLDPATTYYWRVSVNTICGSAESEASFTTYEASCAPGEFTRDIYSEDFSSGEAGWTHGADTGTDTWTVTSANPGPGSGGNAFYAMDLPEYGDQYLVSPAIALPAGDTDYTLQFLNEQNFEDPAGADGGGCWDGGDLEISTDGGSIWTPLDSELITDPYDGFGNNGPPDGINMWCGQVGGLQPWLNSAVNLDAYAGETVHFRLRMLSDQLAGAEGWYVDDFSVSSCSLEPTDVALSGFAGSEGLPTLTVTWLAAIMAAIAGAGLFLRRRLVRVKAN